MAAAPAPQMRTGDLRRRQGTGGDSTMMLQYPHDAMGLIIGKGGRRSPISRRSRARRSSFTIRRRARRGARSSHGDARSNRGREGAARPDRRGRERGRLHRRVPPGFDVRYPPRTLSSADGQPLPRKPTRPGRSLRRSQETAAPRKPTRQGVSFREPKRRKPVSPRRSKTTAALPPAGETKCTTNPSAPSARGRL